jgi:hypothetical protein
MYVGMNDIPEKEMKEIMTIAASMESMKMLCEVPFKDKTIIKLDVSGNNPGYRGERGLLLLLNIYACSYTRTTPLVVLLGHGLGEGGLRSEGGWLGHGWRCISMHEP